jgi:hypothetical protein
MCVSEKFEPILNCFNIKKIFETEHTLRGALIETPSRRGDGCAVCFVVVANVTSAKETFGNTR